MAGVRLFSEVNPGKIRLNRRDKYRAFLAKGRPVAQRYTDPDWALHVRELSADFKIAWSGPPMTGPVRVEVLTVWPRMNRTGPSAGLPLGDVDATSKAVLDALAKAGVLEDDGQVVECVLRKQHGEPGLVVTVEPAEVIDG